MPAAYGLELVRSARRDPGRVRLEGVHALKHALRFGADVEVIVTPDAAELGRLLDELAPDVELPDVVVEVDRGSWAGLTGRELPSPALAVARRPAWTAEDVLAATGTVVVLEAPRHLGNVGAAVRATAAAGAVGVLVVGTGDPWHPTAVRGAAGLQFAVRVARTAALPGTSRPLVAIDPAGAPLAPGVLPDGAVLLFGTERGGLSPQLRSRGDLAVGIPMRAGVSSLNLATAVAVTLYLGRSVG
jgi:RNA methyltransferase, TrmH family